MCLAVPGKIIDISGRCAKVNIMGMETIVNTQLIENPQAGEYVLVHVGCAIEKINKEYFNDLNDIFKEMAAEDNKGM